MGETLFLRILYTTAVYRPDISKMKSVVYCHWPCRSAVVVYFEAMQTLYCIRRFTYNGKVIIAGLRLIKASILLKESSFVILWPCSLKTFLFRICWCSSIFCPPIDPWIDSNRCLRLSLYLLAWTVGSCAMCKTIDPADEPHTIEVQPLKVLRSGRPRWTMGPRLKKGGMVSEVHWSTKNGTINLKRMATRWAFNHTFIIVRRIMHS